MRIPIAKPELGPEERAALLETLETGVFSKGARVEAFERAFAEYHGAKYAVAVSSGTAALAAALVGHGFGSDDEVILPSFSFFATASAVLSVGATPVFADIDPESYCLSPEAAEACVTPRTRAILPVHLYGMPADLPRFEAICRRHGLVLLEDAAQAHGAAIEGRRVGSFGTAAFSFYASKNMTTFEGGMLLTGDPKVYERARLFRNHGRGSGPHELIGGNYRMTELAGAIGSVQLQKLPAWTERRIQNARYFNARLKRVLTPVELPSRTHVFHQYTVRVEDAADRERLLQALNQRGVEARVYYARPIHRQPALEGRTFRISGALPETERASREVLSLPVHPGVGEREREYVVSVLNDLT
jgi:dTDP-4-amino-4,6-dideoxygalactose transaminase